ncbi:beta-carotene dioxygenase, putative [Ixodes scapularis]|uniref:Beta-carotene dioxygenase, putative n=1 Tax=Ixodes scapularis TaxID=6945 RepID=B7QGM1_IXOSC|nr:beta-carotene dioxygenase, putative [Ixodes scapularis]|eukprot:XP_002399872.1 beta-carotene dioxygenase, putative [Ixodes scapularis]
MSTVNRPVVTEFGTKCYPDPCKNIFSSCLKVKHSRRRQLYVTLTINTAKQSVITRRLAGYDLNRLVSVNLASAHPITQEDGTTYNLGASFISGLKYHIVKIPPPCKASVDRQFHSLIGRSFEGTSSTKFVVVERSTGQVLRTRFVTDPLFFFHAVNAFEDDGHVVFDMVAYEDASIMDRYYLDRIRESGEADFDPDNQGHFRRFVIPVAKVRERLLNEGQGTQVGKANSVKEGNLVGLKYTEARAYRQDNTTIWLTHEEMGYKGYDLPTINPKYQGKQYRYTYGSGNFERHGECRNAICKLDVETREMLLWRESDTQFPSEAVFIGDPEGEEEDDGVLLTVVNDTDYTRPDFLLVLDAKTLTEVARAEVPPDVRACTSIHGCFVKS